MGSIRYWGGSYLGGLVVLVAALIAGACAKDPSSATPAAGSERGACYGNGTCNDGLVCLSDLCVRPPPADCVQVARKVGYLTLSNYTPKEQREAFEGRAVAACKSLHLSRDEGNCILRARSRQELAGCPKPLAAAR